VTGGSLWRLQRVGSSYLQILEQQQQQQANRIQSLGCARRGLLQHICRIGELLHEKPCPCTLPLQNTAGSTVFWEFPALLNPITACGHPGGQGGGDQEDVPGRWMLFTRCGWSCLSGTTLPARPPMRAAYVRTAYVMLALLNRNRGGLSLFPGAHLMATPPAATCSQPLQPGATEHHERVRAYEIAAYVVPCPAPVRPRVGLRY
jgi:hypothetical protein